MYCIHVIGRNRIQFYYTQILLCNCFFLACEGKIFFCYVCYLRDMEVGKKDVKLSENQ
jgi:hypothetical protein